MKFLPAAAGMILLSLVPLAAPAQEIGYIDLTDNVFRESSRRVRSGGGSCGGGPFDSGQKSQSEVTVTVLSLDKNQYRIGEDATFEIKVLNSGKKVISVPWTPHLGDLEPADASVPYRYQLGVVLLLFSDPEGHELFVVESLYGSPSVSGSLRELLPGQWFTVKGRKRIELYDQNWGKKEFADAGFVKTKVSGFYRQD